MVYQEARELAWIRSELRDRLTTKRHEGSGGLLTRLRGFANGDAELRSEYERWRLRFDLLSVTT